jgi:hypothetical protein
MTRRIVGSTCAAALFSVGLVAAQTSSPAQQPVTGTSQQSPAQRSQSDAQPAPPIATAATSKDDITMTGCVLREGTSNYVLSSASATGGPAHVAGAVAGSTSTTPGVSASPAPAKSGRYMLSGGGNLASYVGQRVEIVGRVDTSPVGTTGSKDKTLTATPKLMVSSVKATTGACP